MASDSGLIFLKTDGGRIKIDLGALELMWAYAQHTRLSCEAGGVLLGRYIIDSLDVVIDSVSVPTKDDVRKRNYFKRDQRLHQKTIEECWQESKGTCNYLGEWHTHPEISPYPSGFDLRNWKKVLRKSRYDSEFLHFVIVGLEKVKVWEGRKDSLEISLLQEYIPRRGCIDEV